MITTQIFGARTNSVACAYQAHDLIGGEGENAELKQCSTIAILIRETL